MTLKKLQLLIVAFGLIYIGLPSSLLSQNCNFACNDTINISVDRNCEIVVTPDMILEGSNSACSNTSITVISGNTSIGPQITREYVGQILRVDISQGSNSCSAYIKVEDKLAPEIICPPNDTLQCDDNDYAATNASLETYLENLLESTIIDNCDNEEVTVVINDNTLNQACTDPYASIRNISFSALDNHGNATNCSFDIYYTAVPPADIDPPKNFTENMALNCTDNFPLVDGRPYPTVEYLLQIQGEITLPNIDGNALADLVDGIFVADNLCNFMITYTDQEFPACGGSYKIVRTWLVQDWCSINPPANFYQVIKVQDTEINITSGPPSNTVDASNSDCSTTVALDRPTIATNECSNWTWSVLVKEEGQTDYVLVREGISSAITSTSYTFPFGLNMVRYIVTDDCGNTDEYDFNITVRDNDEPMAVCDLRTVITLNEDFNAKVFAQSFDDGSFDVCSDIEYKVRRMDGGCNSTSLFDDFVKFCCEDYGKVIMVELQITDAFGLTSSCMAEAVIQFKGEVLDITCPTDPGIIDCRQFEGFNLNSLTAPIITTRSECIGPFVPEPSILNEDIDECGNGFKSIAWTINYAGADTVICTQNLSFQNLDPFDINDINWPSNRNLSSCDDLAPTQSELDNIISTNTICSNVIYSEPQDRVFQNLSDACVKVLRTWTIVDWCRYPDDPAARWTHVQTILVRESESPEFANNVATIDQDFNSTGCTSDIILMPMASDDCTADDDLIWTYSVGLISGNSVIDVIPETTGKDVNATLDIGNYRATWSVTDHCGNTTTSSFDFEIEDDVNPTASCLSGVTVNVDANTERAILNAQQIDNNSTDNCSDVSPMIRIAGTDNTYVQALIFDCNQVGNVDIEFLVTDDAGNTDICVTNITIADPSDICSPGFNNTGLPCGFVMDLDGEDDFIDVPTLNITPEFTIEAVLFYEGATGDYVTLFEFGNDNPFIGFDKGRLSIFGEIFTESTFPTNAWTHVAVTYSPENNRSRIYLNGNLVKSSAASRIFDGSGFGIGYKNSDIFYNGKMDEVRVWNVERSQEEILSTINDNLTGGESNLIAYYSFDEVGGLVRDASNNLHDGTLMGSGGENIGPQFEQVNTICTGAFTGSAQIELSGQVYTSDNVSIEDVELFAQNLVDADMSYSNTDVTGLYAFDNLPGYTQYKINPSKIDDYTNGVTTLDLILIQMHILGISPLDSPYKLIAGDVNNNGSISSIDLVQLRQLILGIIDELPNNDSWRFVDENHQFADEERPWRFDEFRQINAQSQSVLDNNFIGVKIGDVNGSAQANSAIAGSRSSQSPYMLKINTTKGQSSSVIATEDISINGLQVRLDIEDFGDIVVVPGLLRISNQNYFIDKEKMILSWYSEKPLLLPKGSELFSIEGANIEYTSTVDQFNQLYDAHLQTIPVAFDRIVSEELSDSDDLVLYPNQPNPFSDETTISFRVGDVGRVSIEIYSLAGEMIYQSTEVYSQGAHKKVINAQEVNLNKGIHYYQIKTQNRSLVRKMIVI